MLCKCSGKYIDIYFNLKITYGSSVKKLVHFYIIDRLDYCSILYYELPAYQLKKTTANI